MEHFYFFNYFNYLVTESAFLFVFSGTVPIKTTFKKNNDRKETYQMQRAIQHTYHHNTNKKCNCL